ncbi:Protein translocase subunit SecA, partial [Bienertia sinuspersici]
MRMETGTEVSVNVEKLMLTGCARSDEEAVKETSVEHSLSSSCKETEVGQAKSKRTVAVSDDIYMDDSNCRGAVVKRAGQVLETLSMSLDRQPNINCRVETFGKMCDKFDDRRKRWVTQMGFGGLLYLRKKHLPRSLCYWLMTRIDPINEMFVSNDGKTFRLSKNQVSCVFGIPNGPNCVPSKVGGRELGKYIPLIERVFGSGCVRKSDDGSGSVQLRGIEITPGMVRRAEEYWEESEEHEFKALFLAISLHLVLTPTQGARLAADVVPALCCAVTTVKYDWCSLVVRKLMQAVEVFGRRFYVDGYAGGCGGCSIFLAIFYLDRLNRNPILWGQYPRIKMWNMEQIRVASNADRFLPNGDYGKLGCLDVAYGEWHPREARDVPLPQPFYVEKVNGASIRGGGRRQRAEREEQEESCKRQRLCEREAQSVNPYSQGKSCMGKLRKWSCKGELCSSQMCTVNFGVHDVQKGAIGSRCKK